MSDEKQVLLINWPIPAVKHGGGSIMGYFSVVDTGKLVKPNRRINAAKYIKVLEKKNLLQEAQDLRLEQRFTFQHNDGES